MASSTDTTLAAEAATPSCVAFAIPSAEAMYQQHYGAVLRYVQARVATRDAAEDLASDVFCKAVAGLKTYKPLRRSALPWLYTIAAHRVADYYRGNRPSTGLEEVLSVPDGSPNPSEIAVSHDLVDQVWQLSQNLPASQRRALWLRYQEELEHKEIAQRMGRSVEAVKLLVHRAVRTIRQGMLSADALGLTLFADSMESAGATDGAPWGVARGVRSRRQAA